jgi:CRP-like cAMP-binding protein
MRESILAHPSLVERLVAVARKLRATQRPGEAAQLLEIAAALSPHGASLREEAHRLRGEEGIEDFDRELKRRNLEASHALGMAHIYESRGEFDRAVEMIELAKNRTPFNYLAFAAAAYLHQRNGDPETALKEFIQARRLNPLDFKLAVETSRAALEKESFETALESAIDAMLLATWRSELQLEEERRRVETLARLCHREAADMERLVRSRTAVLQKAADHVALSQARRFSAPRTGDAAVLALRGQGSRSNLLQRANELRTMGLFRHFADDQLIALAKLLELQPVAQDEVIYREGQEGRDLFIVRESTVHVTRQTTIGNQVLTTFGFGSLFGEVSFLDRLERTATAVGVGAGSLYRIPAAALEEAVRRSPEFAVSLLWSFWQTLAEKIRSANAQMSDFFSLPLASLGSERSRTGSRAHVPEAEKLDILHSQGLSAQELRLLATYSAEEHFPPNAMIFAEGESGDTLHIVVDGAVRISRMAPGMGEECLAILGRGEVFGEMALIDGQPRSADARAHRQGCTVFSINRSLLEEVLSMDPDAAVQFLGLLCRLLCRRIRAMNERLVAWRVMASHE